MGDRKLSRNPKRTTGLPSGFFQHVPISNEKDSVKNFISVKFLPVSGTSRDNLKYTIGEQKLRNIFKIGKKNWGTENYLENQKEQQGYLLAFFNMFPFQTKRILWRILFQLNSPRFWRK